MASASLSPLPGGYQSRLSKERHGSPLHATIIHMNVLNTLVGRTPAGLALGPVIGLLTLIKDIAISEQHYVELGLQCADACKALVRALDGKQPDDLSQPVHEAMMQFIWTMEEVKQKIAEKSGRNSFSKLINARGDRETVVAWKADLTRVLLVFNTELAINTNVTTADTQRIVLEARADAQRAISDMHRTVLATRADTRRATSEITRILSTDQAGTLRAISDLHLTVSTAQADMRRNFDFTVALLFFSIMIILFISTPETLRPLSGFFLLALTYVFLKSRFD